MSWKSVKIGDFLKRSKIPIDIKDSEQYKRVTIKGKHKGVSLRDFEAGKAIGTKKQFFLKKGQFVLSKIDARFGAFGIAPAEVDDAIITGNFWAYDVDKDKVNIEWFNQYTNSPIFYDLCERASSGITHRKYLDEKFFLNHEIDIPSIDEQETIIGVIKKQRSSINSVLTELDHQLALVKELRQAFLREAMQGKLVPQDPTDEPAEILLEKIKAEKEKLIAEKRIKCDKPLPPIKPEELPFEIPSNWTWCKLGDLTILITKGSSPKWQGIRYLDSAKDGVLFLTSKNVGSYNLLLSEKDFVEERFNEIEPRSILKKGDLLTNIVGASIGRTALFDIEEVANINQAVCLMRLGHDFVNTIYLLHYFNSSFSTEQMFEKQFAPGRANLSMGDLANFHVPLPPFAEQERIVAKLEKLMKFCDELETNIQEGITNADRLLQTALREALQPK